jgi:hypothetical protein
MKVSCECSFCRWSTCGWHLLNVNDVRAKLHQPVCLLQEWWTEGPESHSLHRLPESESELLYEWRFTANQFVLATSPVRTTTRILIFQLNTCGYSRYVTSSLTRG